MRYGLEVGKTVSRFASWLALILVIVGVHHVNGQDKRDVDATSARPIPEIRWDTTLRHFQFDAKKYLGQRLTVHCPPAAVDEKLEGVCGTDDYPSDSPICVAALHAGKITRNGGTVTLQLNPGKSDYQGSDQNGVRSTNRPRTARSFTFVDGSESQEVRKLHLAHLPRIDWDTKFTSTGFANRNLVGQQFTFRCGPVPANQKPRLVFGTDDYDFASRICWAALHAGKISRDGGIVTVQINSGTKELIGSVRHGVETKSKRSGNRYITFVESPVKEMKRGDVSTARRMSVGGK